MDQTPSAELAGARDESPACCTPGDCAVLPVREMPSASFPSSKKSFVALNTGTSLNSANTNANITNAPTLVSRAASFFSSSSPIVSAHPSPSHRASVGGGDAFPPAYDLNNNILRTPISTCSAASPHMAGGMAMGTQATFSPHTNATFSPHQHPPLQLPPSAHRRTSLSQSQTSVSFARRQSHGSVHNSAGGAVVRSRSPSVGSLANTPSVVELFTPPSKESLMIAASFRWLLDRTEEPGAPTAADGTMAAILPSGGDEDTDEEDEDNDEEDENLYQSEGSHEEGESCTTDSRSAKDSQSGSCASSYTSSDSYSFSDSYSGSSCSCTSDADAGAEECLARNDSQCFWNNSPSLTVTAATATAAKGVDKDAANDLLASTATRSILANNNTNATGGDGGGDKKRKSVVVVDARDHHRRRRRQRHPNRRSRTSSERLPTAAVPDATASAVAALSAPAPASPGVGGPLPSMAAPPAPPPPPSLTCIDVVVVGQQHEQRQRQHSGETGPMVEEDEDAPSPLLFLGAPMSRADTAAPFSSTATADTSGRCSTTTNTAAGDVEDDDAGDEGRRTPAEDAAAVCLTPIPTVPTNDDANDDGGVENTITATEIKAANSPSLSSPAGAAVAIADAIPTTSHTTTALCAAEVVGLSRFEPLNTTRTPTIAAATTRHHGAAHTPTILTHSGRFDRCVVMSPSDGSGSGVSGLIHGAGGGDGLRSGTVSEGPCVSPQHSQVPVDMMFPPSPASHSLLVLGGGVGDGGAAARGGRGGTLSVDSFSTSSPTLAHQNSNHFPSNYSLMSNPIYNHKNASPPQEDGTPQGSDGTAGLRPTLPAPCRPDAASARGVVWSGVSSSPGTTPARNVSPPPLPPPGGHRNQPDAFDTHLPDAPIETKKAVNVKEDTLDGAAVIDALVAAKQQRSPEGGEDSHESRHRRGSGANHHHHHHHRHSRHHRHPSASTTSRDCNDVSISEIHTAQGPRNGGMDGPAHGEGGPHQHQEEQHHRRRRRSSQSSRHHRQSSNNRGEEGDDNRSPGSLTSLHRPPSESAGGSTPPACDAQQYIHTPSPASESLRPCDDVASRRRRSSTTSRHHHHHHHHHTNNSSMGASTHSQNSSFARRGNGSMLGPHMDSANASTATRNSSFSHHHSSPGASIRGGGGLDTTSRRNSSFAARSNGSSPQQHPLHPHTRRRSSSVMKSSRLPNDDSSSSPAPPAPLGPPAAPSLGTRARLALTRFVRSLMLSFIISPMTQFSFFSFELNAHLFLVLHRSFAARLSHFFMVPTTFFMMLLSYELVVTVAKLATFTEQHALLPVFALFRSFVSLFEQTPTITASSALFTAVQTNIDNNGSGPFFAASGIIDQMARQATTAMMTTAQETQLLSGAATTTTALPSSFIAEWIHLPIWWDTDLPIIWNGATWLAAVLAAWYVAVAIMHRLHLWAVVSLVLVGSLWIATFATLSIRQQLADWWWEMVCHSVFLNSGCPTVIQQFASAFLLATPIVYDPQDGAAAFTTATTPRPALYCLAHPAPLPFLDAVDLALWSGGIVGAVLASFCIGIGHVFETHTPPRFNFTKEWIPWTDHFRRFSLYMITVQVLTGIFSEMAATPRLMSYNFLVLMFEWGGYKPELWATLQERKDRAWASGNPALDFIGIGGDATLEEALRWHQQVQAWEAEEEELRRQEQEQEKEEEGAMLLLDDAAAERINETMERVPPPQPRQLEGRCDKKTSEENVIKAEAEVFEAGNSNGVQTERTSTVQERCKTGQPRTAAVVEEEQRMLLEAAADAAALAVVAAATATAASSTHHH